MKRSTALSLLVLLAITINPVFSVALDNSLEHYLLTEKYFPLDPERPIDPATGKPRLSKDFNYAEANYCPDNLVEPVECYWGAIGFNDTHYRVYKDGCDACSDKSIKCFYELFHCLPDIAYKQGCEKYNRPVCVITPIGFVQYPSECMACAKNFNNMYLEGECPTQNEPCNLEIHNEYIKRMEELQKILGFDEGDLDMNGEETPMMSMAGFNMEQIDL
mgnify:CR=1 FL=1